MIKVPFKWPPYGGPEPSGLEPGVGGGRVRGRRAGPQSCERMLGARLQVRPVPSGSTFRAFTTPLSITMENLPGRGPAAEAQAAARPSAKAEGLGVGVLLYLFSRRFPKRDTKESSNSKSVS